MVTYALIEAEPYHTGLPIYPNLPKPTKLGTAHEDVQPDIH